MQLSSFSLQTALFFSRGTLESKKFRKSRGKAKCPSSFSPHRVASTSPPPSPISICKYSLFTFCIQNTLYTKRKKTREGRGKRRLGAFVFLLFRFPFFFRVILVRKK